MEQTQFYIVNVKVKEGFIVNGNKNRLYEKGDVFSYRTGRKPKITHGFLIEFPDKHIVFVDEKDCSKGMIAKENKHNTFLPTLLFNKDGAKFWNELDKLGEEGSN